MSHLRALFVSFSVITLTAFSAFGQSNPYGGAYRGSNADNQRRIHRHCSEPYGQKAFARDYPSLSNANIYHLDRELREFTKYRCLSSEQIRRLAVLYPTDRDKYEYLAYSLNYVFDIENYALAGSVLANHNARDGFYRLLVQEGVPAGDYYNVYNNLVGGYACNTCPQPLQMATPQYPQFQNQNQGTFQGQNQPYQGQISANQPYQQGQISANQPYQQGQMASNQPYQQGQRPQNQSNTYNNLPDPRYNNPQKLPDVYDEPTGNQSLGLNSGYRGLMTYNEFQTMKERIKQNTLDNGKLEAARNLTRANTLTANQVAEIAHLLALDNNRLEYAKFAYEYTYDRQNYLMVADALSFTNNRRSLEQFINSKK